MSGRSRQQELDASDSALSKTADQTDGLCPYRTDWVFRVLTFLAVLAQSPLRRWAYWRVPRAWVIGLSIVVLYECPLVIGAALSGVLESGTPNVDVAFLEDKAILVVFVLFPLGAATIFSFYQDMFGVIASLKNGGALLEEAPEHLRMALAETDKRMNRLWPLVPAAIGTVVVLWLGWDWSPSGKTTWVGELHLLLRFWLIAWAAIGWFSLSLLVWKAWVLWEMLNDFARDRGPVRFQLQTIDPDAYGGVALLASLWLRIHFMGVRVGAAVFALAAYWGWNPGIILGMAVYAVLAPAFFVGPFLPIHRLMVDARKRKIDEATRDLAEAETRLERSAIPHTTSDAELAGRQMVHLCWEQLERYKRLPTWPFDLSTKARFTSAYVLPLLGALTAISASFQH